MSYPIIGVDGSVTSWSSGDLYATIVSRLSSNRARLNIFTDSFDVTALSTAQATHLAGLYSSSGTISGRPNFGGTPRTGAGGLVTFESGYVLHAYRWNIDISTTQVHDITPFATTPPTYKKFRPDRTVISGTYTCRVDATADIARTTALHETGASITLRYGDSSTDGTIAFNAVTTVADVDIVTPGLQEVTYSFVGSGAITPAGTGSVLGTDPVPLSMPPWEFSSGSQVSRLLTLTAITGKTYTVEAFFTRISLACQMGQPVEMSVDFQGSGSVDGTGLP